MSEPLSALALSGADVALRWTRRVPVAARSRLERAPLALSVGLHVALLAILLLAAADPLAPTAEPGIETEVIGAAEFDAALGRAAPVRPPGAESSPAAPSQTSPVPNGAEAAPAAPDTSGLPPPAAARPPDVIRPTRMLSDAALARPQNRGLRRALAGLVDEDRIAQLCDLEAMEQIHAWQSDFQPDRLVDYALSDTRMDGTTLTAHGGAFRSRRKWYEVSYRCELDAGLRKVVGFAFKVGAPIPREEWAADNLPALH